MIIRKKNEYYLIPKPKSLYGIKCFNCHKRMASEGGYVNEIWKDVKGFEGKYKVSNLGRVKSLNVNKFNPFINKTNIIYREKILKPINNGNGYLQVQYHYNEGNKKRRKVLYIHRLVAEAFIPNPENKKEVDHINREKSDNRVENLRWSTRSENDSNRDPIKTHKPHFSKLTNINLHYIAKKKSKYRVRIPLTKTEKYFKTLKEAQQFCERMNIKYKI